LFNEAQRNGKLKEFYAMVVSAHPDDAEFGVGGTVASWTRMGKSVVYVVCTKGEKGTGDRSIASERLAEIRVREQNEAAKVLGVEQVVFLDHPDQGLEDTAEFRKQIVGLIRQFKPQVVATSDPYRRYVWHRDHRIAGQVVLDAVYPYARDHLAYPDLLEKGLEPHKVGELLFWGSEDVNCRIDITDLFDIKLEALRRHESQIGESKYPKVKSWMENRCREMAKGETFALAEGFHRVVIDY
jgi:LmbE family N-acetylglucosaminyl deacetylase